MDMTAGSIGRRAFMWQTFGAGVAAGAGIAREACTMPQGKRANILIIMADDLGFSDIGCYGSEISTPNLDRLARNGLRFTEFYNCARCCPTRASLLTGLYNHQAGVGHMVRDEGFPSYRGYLNESCVTLAEALRPAGYHPLMVGKWHVGEQRPHWPSDRGFERYFGLISGASNYFRLDKGRYMALNDQPFTPPPGGYYMTDAFTDHAVKLLDEFARKPEPFLLYLAYTAPHWPLHALPEDIARYRGKYLKGWDVLRRERHERQMALGLVDRHWPLTPRDPQVPAWEEVRDREAWDLRMAVYAAQIDRMDQGIGRVLAKLKETGQEENTLVIFLADNGGCHEENISGEKALPPGPADSFTSYRKSWANASNTPFRLYKHWVHEGGIAAPFIANWPRAIRRRNQLVRGPAHVTDIMATCLDVAGAQYPKTYGGHEITALEGRSLLPALRGEKWQSRRELFWEHEGNKAVRIGKWKLVSRYPERWELYDLESDRTEMRNLSAEQPEKLNELRLAHEVWAGRCGVMPWEEIQKRNKS